MRVSWFLSVVGSVGLAMTACGGGTSVPVEPFTVQIAGIPAESGSAGALLSMPPFSPADKRGLMKVEVGIPGQPLFE